MKVRSVTYEIAKQIVLAKTHERDPLPASYLAMFIWPGNKMRSQGAGGAASRILKRMEREGLVRWTCRYFGQKAYGWGWIRVRTAAERRSEK